MNMISEMCENSKPTPEQISEYKNESDHDKRIELAYEYQISKADLCSEDYIEILDDMYKALNETL